MGDKGHDTPSGVRPKAATLAARLAERDRRRFVGREAELDLLERCLTDDQPAAVVFVHGPGGIGKSTLLREFERRASGSGWDTFLVEGRELSPAPDALEATLEGARASSRPLILIDTYERMTGLDAYLRSTLLPSLPGSAVIVIGSRAAPDPAWLTGIWEGVATELPLHTLSQAEALRLLEAHGLDDDRGRAIVAWAQGYPLALALAAEAAAGDDDFSPVPGAEPPEVIRLLVRRLADPELTGVRLSALAVAAIARITTVDLLRAVLPDSDAEAAYERLSSLTFAEPVGDGLALHELVRKALSADFRRRDPERERELRRRIVDYLYARATEGNPLLTIDMAHLIHNTAIKWGFGWEGSVEFRVDDVRSGDADQIGELALTYRFDDWWELTRPFFERSPERVAIARDRTDRLSGYMVCMSVQSAPSFAWEDPLVGPWLEHARKDQPLGDSVLWHDSVDLTRDRSARVQAMLGIAGILRSGVANPRFAYMPINPEIPGALEFARAMGAEHIAELDRDVGHVRIECHRIDYGPGGLIAAQRRVVYAELGLPAPPVEDQQDLEDAVDVEAVREALRNFQHPHELARSPLASGDGPDQRAGSVRSVLRDAAEHAFGESENERLLRRVLIHGYIEPSASHEQAALDLSLSRAAYFRRLRAASERVAEYVVQNGGSGNQRSAA
ncbi:MAG TPA: ATP-binding protein [Solirubrobacteraceae bacterium]